MREEKEKTKSIKHGDREICLLVYSNRFQWNLIRWKFSQFVCIHNALLYAVYSLFMNYHAAFQCLFEMTYRKKIKRIASKQIKFCIVEKKIIKNHLST